MTDASPTDPVLYEEDERSSISRITLNRPRVLNAINTPLLNALVIALESVQVRYWTQKLDKTERLTPYNPEIKCKSLHTCWLRVLVLFGRRWASSPEA